MRKLTRAGAHAALATILLLGACDAGDDETRIPADTIAVDTSAATSSRDVPHECALLEETALEQAVGFDVIMNDNSTGNCLATSASGDVSAPTIDFRIEPRTAAYDYFSAQPDATPVADLGDRAIWATLNETTGYVVAVTGDRSIVVGIGAADGVTAESRAQAEGIARLLLDASGD